MTLDSPAVRAIPLFAKWTDDQLEWLRAHTSEVALAPNEVLYREGDFADGFYVVLDGELEVTRHIGTETLVLFTYKPGAFTGEMALLLGIPIPTAARAIAPTRLLKMPPAAFAEMVQSDAYPIGSYMLGVMARRIQNVDGLLHERQKLVDFQKLARSLAHDLNNPAAASRRAAQQLREAITRLEALDRGLAASPGMASRADELLGLQARLLDRDRKHLQTTPLEQTDLDDAVAEWLGENEVEEGWNLAPALVAAGFRVTELQGLANRYGEQDIRGLVQWMAALLEVATLVEIIEEGTSRISSLVNDFKAYSNTDQAPLKYIDVHDGLESTLRVLRYKLRDGVEIRREYDRSLPRIPAYEDELNQVWTNLVDNAIDALEGKGAVCVRTGRDGDSIVVEVTDNGPGIPPEIQAQVFQPFFTTKAKGGGTGLGLDISRRIVESRHHGSIALSSQPGDTRFRVRLPIEQSGAS